ncbi:MAG TPA: flagellar motor protein MotB, partial [Tissierellaceae bacterium]|nr:flagellar motor protein MotB [Tissierellaceae bacterium]
MSRRNFNRPEKNNKGAPPWMTTFSDLMSLLLTFFILLYSMSSIDAIKFKSISQSLQGVLSGLGYTKIVDGPSQDMEIPSQIETPLGEDKEDTLMQNILDVYNLVQDYVDAQGLDANVTVDMDKRGVFVDIKEAILFEPGSAEIKEDGLKVLERLKGIFNDFDNEIVIEGHT